MNFVAALAWIPWVAVKLVLMALGVVVVPFGLATGKWWKLYEATEGRPVTFWELVFRNPVDGMKRYIKHPYIEPGEKHSKLVLESGFIPEDEKWNKFPDYFFWRWRRYKWMASFRMVWIYPGHKYYGEFYFGWKLNSEPPDLDFAMSPRILAKVGN